MHVVTMKILIIDILSISGEEKKSVTIIDV